MNKCNKIPFVINIVCRLIISFGVHCSLVKVGNVVNYQKELLLR